MHFLDIQLDELGRAYDAHTGLYLRLRSEVGLSPAEKAAGLSAVAIGGMEGDFLTLDDEGDLVVWEPPAGHMAN